jgi:hypothetical protein
MPPAANQRLDANPTIHIQMNFLGSTVALRAGELNYGILRSAMAARTLSRHAAVFSGFPQVS